jgi:hypothetical protein
MVEMRGFFASLRVTKTKGTNLSVPQLAAASPFSSLSLRERAFSVADG